MFHFLSLKDRNVTQYYNQVYNLIEDKTLKRKVKRQLVNNIFNIKSNSKELSPIVVFTLFVMQVSALNFDFLGIYFKDGYLKTNTLPASGLDKEPGCFSVQALWITDIWVHLFFLLPHPYPRFQYKQNPRISLSLSLSLCLPYSSTPSSPLSSSLSLSLPPFLFP